MYHGMRFIVWGPILLILITIGFTQCGGAGGDLARLVEERDSLRDISQQQGRRLSLLDTLINSINESLDTIAAGEAGLFVNGVSEGPNKKEQIMGNISRLSSLIERQRSDIENLEKKLASEEQSDQPIDKNMAGLIAGFKKQLAEKDRQIAALKEELNQKNADINQMSHKIGLQSQAIAELDRRNAAQNEALKRQDAMLNHCYMVKGSKKELEQKGIIKKGKLQPQASLDRSKFMKVDIRTFTEIQFNAKRPRILTAMPQSSYTITTDGSNSYTLHITNPTDFWKMSNYLVIQTD